MKRFLPALLLFLSSTYANEIEELLEASTKLLEQTSHEVTEASKKKCPRTETFAQIKTESNALLFMSFSVPVESWKILSQDLEAIGGKILLRGLPKGDFKALASKLEFLRKQGVNASVEINPDLFSQHSILQVPTFVLEDHDKKDLVEGNIPISDSLRMIRDSGETSELAHELMRRFE